MSQKVIKTIEYQGDRYPVIGEKEAYYICVLPWDEECRSTFFVPKKNSKIIEVIV